MSTSEYLETGLTQNQYRERGSHFFIPFMFQTGDRSLPFRLDMPSTLIPGKRYPLVLILHGAGSVGTDNYMPLLTAELFASHPLSPRGKAFILAPQCTDDSHWIDHGNTWDGLNYTYKSTPTTSMQSVLDLLDYVLENFPIDRTRLAVGGNSMGGYGTWDILSRRPGLFKAAFPICGCGDTARVQDYRDTALWFFHGAEDGVVFPECSRRMAKALKDAGKPFNYTEFPNTQHDAWTPTFAMAEFYRWLNAQLF